MKRWHDGSPRVPLSRCPHCGYRMNAATDVSDPPAMPKPGDMGVCFGCGEVLQFDRSLRLVRMSAVEIAGLDPEETAELLAVQRHIRASLASET